MQYLPFGESYIDQRNSSYDERFKFTGKEKDAETDFNYFGARYYDAGISVWLSIDPLSDKRLYISAYNYSSNNPIGRKDPTGMLDGDYYTESSLYLGSDGKKDNKVYVVHISCSIEGGFSQEELSDLGESAGTDDLITDITATTGITHDEFIKLASLANNENGDFEAKLAQANAAYNRYNSSKYDRNFKKAFNSFSGSTTRNLHKKLMKKNGLYASFFNSTKKERSENMQMRNSIVAVINALTGGEDYSNGAWGWHGIDVTLPSWKAYKDFVVKGGFKWADDAYVEGEITPENFPSTEGKRGQYYTITASYGKSIFWRKSE